MYHQCEHTVVIQSMYNGVTIVYVIYCDVQTTCIVNMLYTTSVVLMCIY